MKNSLYIANLGNLDVVEFKMMTFIRGKLKKWENQYYTSTYNIIYSVWIKDKIFYFDSNIGK